jgi:NhaP-type Na+/H+ or K+/H+ antiporter
MSCIYKDSLGIPGQGFHTHLLGIAILDVIGTILIAEILAYVFNWNIYLTLIAAFLTGIVLHRMFCVRTTLDKILFP